MSSLDDRSLSVFALAVVAALGWRSVFPSGGATPAGVESAALQRPAGFSVLALETRVGRIAEAIALAEGYYARGRHDGHSLPYLLNNPGLLKASAIADRDITTWEDTGFLVFPSAELGWAALRYQVCSMLLGTSRIYELSDTLVLVGVKYADGDVNWGHNVAGALGVAADARLAELAAGLTPPALPGSIRCRQVASEGVAGRHAHADAID